MRRARFAAGMALVLALSACGGGSDENNSGQAEFNAAASSIVNPSDQTGGTLNLALSDDWDSIDPGNTYYAFSWNFARLYGRALTSFKPVPGKDGLQVVPDLATDLGQVSDGGKTVT